MILATADKEGNLIIWKIKDKKFKILTNISNFSESTITYLQWTPEGDILFASNSNGSLLALEFNEYSTKTQINYTINTTEANNSLNIPLNPMINNLNSIPPQRIELVSIQQGHMKRITPTLINNNSNLVTNQEINRNPTNINDNTNSSNDIIIDSTNSNRLLQDYYIRCIKPKFDSLETKIFKIRINSVDLEKKNVCIVWENKVYDNYSNIQLLIENTKCLYVNKLENKLIRLFSCNNFCYVVYDTHNLLSVFTLLNTIVI
jgi:hypothetical protein